METKCRRKNSSSDDKFSFPVIIQEPEQFEFEFGSVTSPNSPADQLFSNGKLLPHAFPIHTPNTTTLISYSRSGSRTSSISSKESYSWMSSRSNSTNSRSSTSTSTSTSARTSISEASERRLHPLERKDRALRPALNCQYHSYGSSRRWQLIAVPVPVLQHQGSRSRKADSSFVLDRKGSKKSQDSKSWFGRRFLKSFVSTCKECHAIKT